jgi:PTS system fructose-specific IIB component
MEDINNADAILLAISVAIEEAERFEEKQREGKVYIVDPSVVIKSPQKVMDDLIDTTKGDKTNG